MRVVIAGLGDPDRGSGPRDPDRVIRTADPDRGSGPRDPDRVIRTA